MSSPQQPVLGGSQQGRRVLTLCSEALNQRVLHLLRCMQLRQRQMCQPRFKVARGFGEAVPMSFAVRQIVPAAVRVHYGPGIDPDILVSWKGNRPWNQALAAAVRPLHLRIVTGTQTVLITR